MSICKVRKYKVHVNPLAYFRKYFENKCLKWEGIENIFGKGRTDFICALLFKSTDLSPFTKLVNHF